MENNKGVVIILLIIILLTLFRIHIRYIVLNKSSWGTCNISEYQVYLYSVEDKNISDTDKQD